MIFIFFILNLIGLSPPSRIPSPLIIQKLQRCFNDQKFENLILSFPDLRNNFTLYEPYVKISPIVFMPLIFKYDIALSSETINHAFQLLFNTQPSYCSYKDKLLSLIEQFASYTYYRPHLNDILLLIETGLLQRSNTISRTLL